MGVKLSTQRVMKETITFEMINDDGEVGEAYIHAVFKLPSNEDIERTLKFVSGVISQSVAGLKAKGDVPPDQYQSVAMNALASSDDVDSIVEESEWLQQKMNSHFMGFDGVDDEDGNKMPLKTTKQLYIDGHEAFQMGDKLYAAWLQICGKLNQGKAMKATATKPIVASKNSDTSLSAAVSKGVQSSPQIEPSKTSNTGSKSQTASSSD